jgi:hypothetical protein
MDIQVAEPAPECLVLLDGQVLIPEEDDQMAHPRRVDLIELLRGQGLAQIGAEDLRAYGRGECSHLNRLELVSVVGHRSGPPYERSAIGGETIIDRSLYHEKIITRLR